MGTKIFHVGGLGQGLAMKLVNNMLVQVNMVAVAEALVMGVKAGLDPQTIYDVVRVSTGTSYAFEHGAPKMLARDFSPGGSVDIYFKDQELETAFAKQLGVPLLLANLTQQVYQMARAAGLNKQDGSAILQVLERLAGVHVATPRRAGRWGLRRAAMPPSIVRALQASLLAAVLLCDGGAASAQDAPRQALALELAKVLIDDEAQRGFADQVSLSMLRVIGTILQERLNRRLARFGGTDAGRHRPGLRRPHAAPGPHPGDRRAGLCEPLRRGGAAGAARFPAVGGGPEGGPARAR